VGWLELIEGPLPAGVRWRKDRMHADPNCTECHGTSKVMLFLGASPCKTCGGTQPSEWSCNPLDLLLLKGGYGELRKVCIDSSESPRWGGYRALQVVMAPYECAGAPLQILPFLNHRGANLHIALHLVMQPLDRTTQTLWLGLTPVEEYLKPSHIDAVSISISGPITITNTQAVASFMMEAKKSIGRVDFTLQFGS